MYGTSKLANGLFTLELSKRLAGTNATANSVHPGVINTNLGQAFPLVADGSHRSLIGWTFMKPVEAGAATQTYVATAPALAGYSGYYFADCNPIMPDPRMLNEPNRPQELWDVSVDACGRLLLPRLARSVHDGLFDGRDGGLAVHLNNHVAVGVQRNNHV